MMHRYFALSFYLRQRFGQRVQKIPLDAGFNCPNRDGSLSRAGCLFCNPRGSGTGLGAQGLDLARQWDFWRNVYLRKRTARLFIAYLQSFSNTYGPPEKIARVLETVAGLPDLAGIALGTRPDCVDREKLRLFAGQPVAERWLELGLQTADDGVLRRINRGHSFADFRAAVDLAAPLDLKLCVHVVAGLPGEAPGGLLATVRALNALPIHGIKFHNLYVCSGSSLEELWRRGDYVPLERERYLQELIEALAELRPDIVIHRLTADPAPGELLAPTWAADKRALLQDIAACLEREDLWQGCRLHPAGVASAQTRGPVALDNPAPMRRCDSGELLVPLREETETASRTTIWQENGP